MNKIVILCLSLFFFISMTTAQAGKQEAARNEAVAVAITWLSLVDQGDYKNSWEQAASYFKTVISREKWVQSLISVRKPLGLLASRTLLDSHYKTELPGAPDAEYVVVQFQTSFSNKQQAVEMITPMRGKDGIWRVAGYFIR